jgi:hypothetical protein
MNIYIMHSTMSINPDLDHHVLHHTLCAHAAGVRGLSGADPITVTSGNGAHPPLAARYP